MDDVRAVGLAVGVHGLDIVVDQGLALAGHRAPVALGPVGGIGNVRALVGRPVVGGHRHRLPGADFRAPGVGLVLGRTHRPLTIQILAPLEGGALHAAHVVDERPHHEIGGRVRGLVPHLAAGVVGLALGRENAGTAMVAARIARDDFVGLGDGQIAGPGRIAVPRIGRVVVPIPIAARLAVEIEMPRLGRVVAEAPLDVVDVLGAGQIAVFHVVGGEHAVLGGHQHAPRIHVGHHAVAVLVGKPLLVVRRAAVDADPAPGLDVDHVVGIRRIQAQIVLHAGVFEIGVGIAHVHEGLVLAVPGIGVLHAVVVAVAVAQQQHRLRRVVVGRDVAAPHVFRLEGAVAAASVFVALVASRRHRDDLLDRAVRRIHIARVMRLVGPRRQHLRRRPHVLQALPGAAQVRRTAVAHLGLVRPARTSAVPREVVDGAEEMAVVHDHPFEPFGHQRGDHRVVEGAFRRPKALRIGAARVPSFLVLLLVQLDLHAHRFHAGQRHQAVVVGDPHHVQPRVARTGLQIVARVADVAAPARIIPPQRLVVLRQRPRIAHLRTAVARRPRHRARRPVAIAVVAVAIPHPLHAEIEPAVGIDRSRRFIGKINRLVHVPQMRHMDRHRLRRDRPEAQTHRHPSARDQLFHLMFSPPRPA